MRTTTGGGKWQRCLALAAVVFATGCVVSGAIAWLQGPPRATIRMPMGESEAFNGDETTDECDGRIVFPRDRIPKFACEGYWRDSESVADTDPDAPAPLPFPAARPLPFCGQHLWAKRLAYLEARAREALSDGHSTNVGIAIARTRGLSPSRLTGELLGNLEFTDTTTAGARSGEPVCWTGDFREHYVGRFNVAPSREFYHYVLAAYDRLAPTD
uniref:Uncharacterized protein n=1 Tax=Neobodo designis TaxID=312471 RepID=A0A7S1QA16_NEODS